MDVSVLVPTWRRPEDLSRCLAGLAAQTRAPGEVVVVTRDDDAATWALLQEPRDDGLPVRAARLARSGVVEALRSGFELAAGRIVAITDDDSVPRPDWLERIESAFARDERLGGMGGRDFVHESGRVLDDGRPEVGRLRWYGRVVGNHHLGVGPAREVDVLKGVNMAFRREALAAVRLSEGLRGGGAQVHWEVDLCLAVTAAGWRLLYDPALAVDHYPAARFDDDQRTERSLEAVGNETFNLTYVLLRRLPRGRAALALGYGLLVGSREAPGLVTALERVLRGRRRPGALAACSRARVEALGQARTQPGRGAAA